MRHWYIHRSFRAVSQRLYSGHVARNIVAEAVDSILQIIANSMLAITVFSLSTMVAAYAKASAGATPRATELLLQDNTAQNALSTFIGAFLYSLVGIIALYMGVYGESGCLIPCI